jgi:hypothetical protein
MTTLPGPMTTGPTMRDPRTSAPASILTPPMISLSASTKPSIRGSRLSRSVLLTSSMPVTFPVSFQ